MCVCKSRNMNLKLTAGFSLIELIVVIIIVGILAATVAPRFFDSSVFQSRGFADQVQATLRYAQKEAIAQHRNVCVAITANDITLTIADLSGAGVACSLNLALPAGGNSISVPLNSGITLLTSPVAPPVSFNFDALGSTATAHAITFSGAPNSIVVEAETGYVHSP
jgi:MSHA pilin protein MshC